MRLLIISDAWYPQVNGVVRTLATVQEQLRALGDTVEVIGPAEFRSMPMPGYHEIRLALRPGPKLRRIVEDFGPDAVHIATEGPLGWAMRRLCLQRGWAFTTSFHTRFPDYLAARTGIPTAFSWAVMRRFHAAGNGCFVATPTLGHELAERGFPQILPWTRGVDLHRFGAARPDPYLGLPRPIFLHVGRVAVEKNIAAFLKLDLPGSKVVVGDGPMRAALAREFPAAHFWGYRENGKLAACYAGADVLVFPSRTDTFGLVMLEAMACGTPVAAFPVAGPLDVVGQSGAGVLDENLREAALAALSCSRGTARSHAESFSWANCAAIFRAGTVRLHAAH